MLLILFVLHTLEDFWERLCGIPEDKRSVHYSAWDLYRDIKEKKQKKIVSQINLDTRSREEADPATKPILLNKDGRLDTRKTILAIDDDTAYLHLYGLKYVKAGLNAYTLTTADGNIVQKVAGIKPDIIILDILMPGRNGIEALGLLKESEETKNIPVVMLTNQNNKEDIETAKNLGAIEYIIQVNTVPSEVVDKILKHLESK